MVFRYCVKCFKLGVINSNWIRFCSKCLRPYTRELVGTVNS